MSSREKARSHDAVSSLFPPLQESAAEESTLGKNNVKHFLKTTLLSVRIKDDKQFRKLILARKFVFKFKYVFTFILECGYCQVKYIHYFKKLTLWHDDACYI